MHKGVGLLIVPCISSILSVPVSGTKCRSISVSGTESFDGEYNALFDFRGRPDFYSIDGNKNLFGEEDETHGCTWRINDIKKPFPYYTASDCALSPPDIIGNWTFFEDGKSPEIVKPTIVFSCINTKEKNVDITFYILVSFCILLFFIVLLLLFSKWMTHVNGTKCSECEKRRLHVQRASVI